jgi:hypothetical protein
MPSAASGGVLSMWASHDFGGVHFTQINTETDFNGAGEENTGDSHVPWLPAGHFAADGEYMRWLAADIAAAAANPATPYIVVHGHRPMEDLPAAHAAALVEIFKGRVDLYLCGHGHTYIRYNADAFGDGATHIMTGGAGSDETRWPADQLADTPRADERVAERLATWCEDADARAVAAATNTTTRPRPACPHLAAGLTPAATSDKLSLATIVADAEQITYKLLRAPDGALIDSVVVPRKTARRV